jgi:hypothetical protein
MLGDDWVRPLLFDVIVRQIRNVFYMVDTRVRPLAARLTIGKC